MKADVQNKVESALNATRSEIEFTNVGESATLYIRAFGDNLVYNYRDLSKLSTYFKTSKINFRCVELTYSGVTQLDMQVINIPGDTAHKLFPDMIKNYKRKHKTTVVLETKYKDTFGGPVSYGDAVDIIWMGSNDYRERISTYNSISLVCGESEWEKVWERYTNNTAWHVYGYPVNMSLYKRLLVLYANETKELYINDKHELYFTVGDIKTKPIYDDNYHIDSDGSRYWDAPNKTDYIDSYGGECWSGDNLHVTYSHNSLNDRTRRTLAHEIVKVGHYVNWIKVLDEEINHSNGKQPTVIVNYTLYTRLLEVYKLSKINNKEIE